LELLDAKTFHTVQLAHWRKLPYWVLAPAALSFAGSIALVWYHPAGSPRWAIWGNLACQLLSHGLTAALWGRWQAKLSTDPLGAESPFLAKILATHLAADAPDQRGRRDLVHLDGSDAAVMEIGDSAERRSPGGEWRSRAVPNAPLKPVSDSMARRPAAAQR